MVTATCLLTPSRQKVTSTGCPKGKLRDGTLQAAHILDGLPGQGGHDIAILRPAFAAGRPRSLWRSRRRPHWSIPGAWQLRSLEARLVRPNNHDGRCRPSEAETSRSWPNCWRRPGRCLEIHRPTLDRELMPITFPSRLTSGPPLLPGLMAASVCKEVLIHIHVNVPALALIIPEVTVPVIPRGAPTARTRSPISMARCPPSRARQRFIHVQLHDGQVGLGIGLDVLGEELSAVLKDGLRLASRP